ncbi:CAMP-dependent protein kinase regulatory subunit [Plakobranchus ocellatus]|uniref:cAMP-dependent protein kinase regulatory subunit n=1 Tax=Plakobranchus ocellatus TaxID=259542 RepID=A0AAV3XYG2_9GAST|nr:CAMP-dependent protein kinase regulatory subunit [Plakobranchus ocellatus]
MHSVHFPKLEEYAIEPVLIKEPSSYGSFVPSSEHIQAPKEGNQGDDSSSSSKRRARLQRTKTLKEPDITDSTEINYRNRVNAKWQKNFSSSFDHFDKPSVFAGEDNGGTAGPLGKSYSYEIRKRKKRLDRKNIYTDKDQLFDVSKKSEDESPSFPRLFAGPKTLVSGQTQNALTRGRRTEFSHSGALGNKTTTTKNPFRKSSFGDKIDNTTQQESADVYTNLDKLSHFTKEEAFPNTVEEELRQVYKGRKVDKQTLKRDSLDNSTSLKNDDLSQHLPPIESSEVSKKSMATSKTLSFQEAVARAREKSFNQNRGSDHATARHNLKSRLPNGFNYIGGRQGLWRMQWRNVFPSQDQLQKFQKLVVGIVNVLKLAKAIIKPTDSPSALLKNFTAMAKEPEKEEDASDNMKSWGLEFDASYFRANREISVSSEVKNILRQPPSRRTPEQIQTAIFGLQSLPSFAEYPLHMQEKLAKVAWYEIVTPMRTIIRQGHFAENFYFILSGQALVTIHKPGDVTPKTAGMMRRGTSFGELALLHHSRRTATVTSHDTVQLLSVGREDFFDIFMSGHGSEEMPEHIKFISQLDFMKDWPLERLLERPDQCLLHFFKRNMVILKASEVSEWFYVVKSGSCQVLKQLKGVTGRLGQLVTSRHSSHDLEGKVRSGASFQGESIW